MDEYEEEAQDEQAQKAISDVERNANASEETAKNTKDLKDSIDNLTDKIDKKGKGKNAPDEVHIVEDHDQKENKEKERNNAQTTANNTARSVEEQQKTNQNLNDLKQPLNELLQKGQQNNDLLKESIRQGKQNQQKTQAKPEAKTKPAPKSEEKEEAKNSSTQTKPKKPRQNSTPKQEKAEEAREQKDAKWREAKERFEKAYGNKNTPAGKVLHDADFRHGKRIYTAKELGLTKEQQDLIKNAVKEQHNLQNANYPKLLKHQMEGWGFEPSHFIRYVVSGQREKDFNPKEYLHSYSGDARSFTRVNKKPKRLEPYPKRAAQEAKLAPKLSGPLSVTSPLTPAQIKQIEETEKAKQAAQEREKARKAQEREIKRLEELHDNPIDADALKERKQENLPLVRTLTALQIEEEEKRVKALKETTPSKEVLKETARKQADEEDGLGELTEEQRKKLQKIADLKKENDKNVKRWYKERKKEEQRLKDEYEKEHPAPSLRYWHDERFATNEEFKQAKEERLAPVRVIYKRDEKGKILSSSKVRQTPPTVEDIERLHYRNGIIPDEELALKPSDWWNKKYTGTADQRNVGVKTREGMAKFADPNRTEQEWEYSKKKKKFVDSGIQKWEEKYKKPETDTIRLALKVDFDAPEFLHLERLRAEAGKRAGSRLETTVTEDKHALFGVGGAYIKSSEKDSTATPKNADDNLQKAKENYKLKNMERINSRATYESAKAADYHSLTDFHYDQIQNREDKLAKRKAQRKYEQNMAYFTNGHRGMGGAYHDRLTRGLLYRGFLFIDWRSGLLKTTAERIVGDTAADAMIRDFLGYKTVQTPVYVPKTNEEGEVIKDSEGNVQYAPKMVQATDKNGQKIFNEDGTPKMIEAKQTELISDENVSKKQLRLRKFLGFNPVQDEQTGYYKVPTAENIATNLIGLRASFAGVVKKMGLVALPLLVAAGLAGGTTAEIRDVRNRTINNGTTAGQAFGNTVQDAIFDVAHMFGFSANTGKDIREDRQEALQQNYKLFGQKADNLVSTNMWALSMGFDTQADKNWIEEQVAMGKSAQQVRNSFLNLTKIANQTGVSFKNLSEAVATEETNADKLLGSKYTGGLVKGTAQALQDLKNAGLNGTEQTLTDLTNDPQFELPLTRELNAKGYAEQASELAATPSLLMKFALDHHVFGGALQNYSRQYYNAAGGRQLAYEALLVKSGGLKASDVQSSLQTMYSQIKTSVNASGNNSSSSTNSNNNSNKKQTAPQPQVLEIRLQPGTVGKVIANGKYQQGLHDVTGTGHYFAMQNFTTGGTNE